MVKPMTAAASIDRPRNPRSNDRKEGAALTEVVKALKSHPDVAWCERQNSGAAKVGGRYIRFGWPGCSDVIGQFRDGRFLACEVKTATGKLRPEQAAFLALIRASGGVAFMARDVHDVMRELARPIGQENQCVAWS